MRVDGKNILITGALGSLGKAQTEALLEGGANMYLLDLDKQAGDAYTEELKQRFPEAGTIEFHQGDLDKLTESHNQVKALSDQIGGFDVLINNAAVMPHKPIEELSVEEYERTLRINSHSAFALTKAVVPAMKEKEAGRIINFCSITMNGMWEHYVPYIASKGELLALTRALARELGPWNILVNSVAPGAIPSEAEQRVFGHQWEEYNQWVLDHQSLKHRGETKDIGETVLFLCSDHSKFITGQNIHVNGGWYMEG